MKLNLLLLLLVLSQNLLSQSFEEAQPAPEFDGVWGSSIAFSDFDRDGDEDVLITGWKNTEEFISKLYTNEQGSFTEVVGTPFDGVSGGCIAFSDIDGDGDKDVLIVGLNNSQERIAKLYTNNQGIFSEVKETPFEGLRQCSMAFSDIDGDGDEDVLITGQNKTQERIAKMYTNNGGIFTEVVGTPFTGVWLGSIAFSDIDADGDNDVLLTGENNSGVRIAKLYTNNGGFFSEVIGASFEGVRASSIGFSDVDDDGDDDVLITGENNSEVRIAKLYKNNGGSFSEVMGTSFEGVWSSSIAFSDVDGDGDEDVLITGQNNSLVHIAKLYTNVEGNFSEVVGTPFEGVWASSIAFSDIDGDNDNDVLITGSNNSGLNIAKLYINKGIVNSTNQSNSRTHFEFKTFPNPSTSTTLYLRYMASEMCEVTVKIYNMNGVLIKHQCQHTISGQHTLSINIASLVQGSYFVELDDGKRRSSTKFNIQ